MDLADLMKTNPRNLAALQHKELKNFALGRLTTVIELLKEEKYPEVEKLLEISPSGDGYGKDNRYINFSLNPSIDIEDIGHVVDTLAGLKEQAKVAKDREYEDD